MNKKNTLSACALLISLLTACSSGGSGSPPNTAPQKQLQPEAKPEVPQPESKPEVPQPESKPEVPQPETKPEVPQPEAKPEVPQPEAKPEVPQPEAKPEVPQPEAKPEVPQPEAKPEVPQPEAKPEEPQPEPKPEEPQLPEKPIYTGTYFSDTIKNRESVNLIVDKLPNSENLDTIVINGKTIKLSDTTDRSIGWLSNQLPFEIGKAPKIGPNHLEHSIFGLYNTVVDNTIVKIQGFSVGKQTPENTLPTEGTIQYIGNTWNHFYKDMTYGFNYGDANFNVDFTRKILNGSISLNTGEKVELPESKIEGSSFTGKTDNITVSGSFYGDKAQELGGIAVGTTQKSNTKFTSAFGAKQQP